MARRTAKTVLALVAVMAVTLAGVLMTAAVMQKGSEAATSKNYPTLYKTIKVDGLDIFYR